MKSPLDIFARKQKVGADDARTIELPLLIHLDAAQRRQCGPDGVEHLAVHLTVAAYLAAEIAARVKSSAMYDRIVAGYYALERASDRNGQAMALTTGEYQALRDALKAYFWVLPQVEVGLLSSSMQKAARIFNEERNAA
jgi:hypothetical protein